MRRRLSTLKWPNVQVFLSSVPIPVRVLRIEVPLLVSLEKAVSWAVSRKRLILWNTFYLTTIISQVYFENYYLLYLINHYVYKINTIIGNGNCIVRINKEFFILFSMKNLFIIGNEQSTNRFENPLNLKKYLLVRSFFLLSSMLTCLIAILMLLVSLKTLVKREPLNTASLDTGYKLISIDWKQ